MSRFDPKKTHGLVYGHPKVKYTQNGKHYAGDGTRVILDGEQPDDEKDDGQQPSTGETAVPPSTLSASALEAMHWTQLRALLSKHGGTWTNKQDAIAFLTGKSG